MRTSTTATATERVTAHQASIPVGFHIVAAVWLLGMLVLSQVAPDAYRAFVQEDRFVEWWTATLFAVAAFVRLRAAWARRRPFDFLVGLFCLFVAGEEISWGQRLLGFTPPGYFLAHNTQQEFTLHNFADIFGKPKIVLILALAGFGILLPLARLLRPLRRLEDGTGATPPALALLPWFVAAITLLLWYPVDFTGEWVEAFAGLLFLAAAGPWTKAVLLRAGAGAALAAVLLTFVSDARGRADRRMVDCARTEASALLADVTESLASNQSLLRHSVHKRMQSAIESRYVTPDLYRYRSAQCAGETPESAELRRRYEIDPWGLAYWIRSQPDARGVVITVYSFGPNRRRDHEPGQRRGDDVLIVGRFAPWRPFESATILEE